MLGAACVRGKPDIRDLPADEEESAIIAAARNSDAVFRELEKRYPDKWVFVSYLKNPSTSPILNLELLAPPCYDVTYQRPLEIKNNQIEFGTPSLRYAEVISLNAQTRNVQYGQQQGEINEASQQKIAVGGGLLLPKSTSPVSFETLRRFWTTIIYPK
jgi:hypothetical protein